VLAQVPTVEQPNHGKLRYDLKKSHMVAVSSTQSFVKQNTKLRPLLQKRVCCKKMALKSSHWSYLKACSKGHTFCFTTFWSDNLLEHSEAMNEPQKNVQMTLEDQSFINKFKVSFVCLEDV
jgi:hypothetical protein